MMLWHDVAACYSSGCSSSSCSSSQASISASSLLCTSLSSSGKSISLTVCRRGRVARCGGSGRLSSDEVLDADGEIRTSCVRERVGGAGDEAAAEEEGESDMDRPGLVESSF